MLKDFLECQVTYIELHRLLQVLVCRNGLSHDQCLQKRQRTAEQIVPRFQFQRVFEVIGKQFPYLRVFKARKHRTHDGADRASDDNPGQEVVLVQSFDDAKVILAEISPAGQKESCVAI